MHPAPIFLLGHPKSGTTAIAELLARATGLAVTLDLFQTHAIARDEAADLIMGRTTMADFVGRHPHAFATPLQKCPKLTFAFEALRRHFPDSRFASIVRDPRDTIRSFLFRRGLPGDAERLPRPLELLPEGLPHDHYVAQLAERWNRAADVALADPVVSIRYEDFARDKVGEIARLADRLGLAVTRDISPWLAVPFKPYSAMAADRESFFGPANLARIERVCGARMRALDYRLAPGASAAA
ncbi:MAG: sulfotransferase [Sphingomonas sp.]